MASISLDDANVWDDSALIRSWEDALEEYKKYHSIHARGENVEEVLAEHLNGTVKQSDATADCEDDQSAAMSEDGEVVDADVPAHRSQDQRDAPSAAPPQSQDTTSNISALFAGQDQVMKNLMMSWYWTGYYSGLQAAQASQAASKSAASTIEGAV